MSLFTLPHISNMSAPSRSTVTIRPLALPGRNVAVVFSLRDAFPQVWQKVQRAATDTGVARLLLKELGHSVRTKGQDPEETLRAKLKAGVVARKLSGFALVWARKSDPETVRSLSGDVLLTLFVLSQSSGAVFVANKEANFDRDVLDRVLEIRDERFISNGEKP